MIDETLYHEARILLASQNIPRSATAGGFENLLEQGSMTTSRFMENTALVIETELASSITEIASIRGARVLTGTPSKRICRNQRLQRLPLLWLRIQVE